MLKLIFIQESWSNTSVETLAKVTWAGCPRQLSATSVIGSVQAWSLVDSDACTYKHVIMCSLTRRGARLGCNCACNGDCNDGVKRQSEAGRQRESFTCRYLGNNDSLTCTRRSPLERPTSCVSITTARHACCAPLSAPGLYRAFMSL